MDSLSRLYSLILWCRALKKERKEGKETNPVERAPAVLSHINVSFMLGQAGSKKEGGLLNQKNYFPPHRTSFIDSANVKMIQCETQGILCSKVTLLHAVIMSSSWSITGCIFATNPPLFTPQCQVEANWNWFCLSTQTHSFHTERPGALKHKSIFRPGPYFLISIHLADWFWPKSHQLLYYGATCVLFVWVQLSKELLKGQWSPNVLKSL